jgi:hypothetical protein
MKQLPYIQTSTAITGYSDSVIAKNETNDCFVRSVASAYNVHYDEAHTWVKEKFNRVDRKGTKWVSCKMATMATNGETFNNKTIKTIDKLRTFTTGKYGTYKMKRTTLNQFIKKYPTGTYILIVRGHAFTLKDGSVIGNPSDAKSIKKVVHEAFEIC